MSANGVVQRFGIEEEYFITDLKTRRMLAAPDEPVLAACREALGAGFAYEMFQGQVELASPVFTQTDQAAEYMGKARARLGQALAEHGLGFICAGAHPLADWREQQQTPQSHFRELFAEIALVARRSVLSGLHVHAEIPAGVDRIAVMNEVLPWTPLLLAMSTSSPFWDGVNSGYMSYRQAVCDEWPRMGIPEHLANETAFAQYLDTLRQAGAIAAKANVWWAIRPSLSFPTLELRITDACPRLADALLLAGLFRLMVRHACCQAKPGSGYTAPIGWLLKENRAQARRWGRHGRYVLAPAGDTLTLEQWLDQANDTFGSTAQALGEEGLFDQARRLLRAGTSAERQLRFFDAAAHTPSPLMAVAEQLLEESRQAL